MRIAVDAMGSDNAPDVEVAGAVQASLESSDEIVLVGDEAVLNEKLKQHGKHGNIEVVHASERIGMDDTPVAAIRQKKDASLLVAMRLVKEGKADAIVSAGNTGAVMVGARTVLGPIRGVARSAICQALPTATGRVVVLDLGANVGCTARHLCEFAEMGVAYSTYALGVDNPRVALLNIGEEDVKGGSVAKEVHRNLKASTHVNFLGNIEPKAMYNGGADVVVCDGFIGNILLKTSESVAGVMGKLLKDKLTSSARNKLGALLANNALQEIKTTVDPNYHPGAPLLGVNGVVIITHGSCTELGLKNAILGAATAVRQKLNDHIRENIEELRQVEAQFNAEEPAEVAE
jgi:glycerol-3-phosphate acyltransferase PlsX